MELIKKTVQLVMTTGTTACTTGTCYIIIPNTGVTYVFKIGLTTETQDIGFLDAYTVTGSYQYIVANNKFYSYLTGGTSYNNLDFAMSSGIISGTTNDADYNGYTYAPYIVTGGGTSRLAELKKYATSLPFSQRYTSGGNWSTDGVDYINTIENVRIIYYLGGIRYVDELSGSTSGTTFSFIGKGLNNPNFINVPVYKDPTKENIISNPKIDDDVFIVRQELSAFENNYRLEYIKNLSELETYASGKYFNIIKNS